MKLLVPCLSPATLQLFSSAPCSQTLFNLFFPCGETKFQVVFTLLSCDVYFETQKMELLQGLM
jgi:hypothetical protein